MRIAVIHHNEDLSNDYAAYLATLLDDTAGQNNYTVKDYHRLVLFKETLNDENAILHIIIPAARKFYLKYWYAVKLPAIFKKYKIDKVLCTYAISTKSNLPQLLIIPDIALLEMNKKILLWQHFAAKRLKESMTAANSVITYSNNIKKELEKVKIVNSEKVFVFPYTVGELFKPMEWHNKLYIKSRFAENKEFFAAILPDENEKIFTELLKSFSKFKKWQQSSMQLLLLPKEEGFTRAIENKLDSYRYKNDVKLINDADKKETADIIAAAYALLHLSIQDSDLWPVVASLQSGTPIIASYTTALKEYCGDAGILVTEEGFEAFGDQLVNIYKNEALRTKMSEAAIEKSKQLEQNKYANELWECIHKT